MQTYKYEKIRNVAILGHGGCGKTTLVEAMAYTTGITKRRFLPNLQTVRTTDGKGNTKRMTVCTRCIKNGKVTKG